MSRLVLASLLLASAVLAEDLEFKVEVVATGLRIPWGLAFPNKDTILVTERPGTVRRIVRGKLEERPLARIDVDHQGEGGLMDIELHPAHAENGLLYLSYMRAGKVSVIQYRYDGKDLERGKVVIGDIPAARYHAGCRLGFGPDGRLYITTGDATRRALAQRLDSLAGKTLRLNPDGTVPDDNPFVKTKGARPEIWSVGHRNAQGIDWHPETKLMVQTEHGPSGFDGPGGGDEVNIVERGKNYGWPVIHHRATREGMVSPLLEYTPAVAPASGVFFRGDYYFGCLRGARLIRVVFDGRKAKEQQVLLKGTHGRIREVAAGPDGNLYATTSNRDGRGRPHADDDRVLRLVPR
jgi:glucose/arabinose dehydrogenase